MEWSYNLHCKNKSKQKPTNANRSTVKKHFLQPVVGHTKLKGNKTPTKEMSIEMEKIIELNKEGNPQ